MQIINHPQNKKSRVMQFCSKKVRAMGRFLRNSLLLAGLVSCACSRMPDTPYHWPALAGQESGEVIDVTLGISERHKLLYAKDFGYFETEDIPDKLRARHREEVQKRLDYSAEFFKKDVFRSIISNNIFSVDENVGRMANESVFGLHMEDPRGFLATDMDGKVILSCFGHCGYNKVLIKSRSSDKAMFHELLHDAWYSELDEAQRNEFRKNALLFFSAGGSTKAADDAFHAIWFGSYYDQGMVRYVCLKGCSFPDWAESKKLKKEECDAIRMYLHMRALAAFFIQPHYSNPAEPGSRDHWITKESFAFLPSEPNATVPGFMSQSYGTLLEENKLRTLEGHFFSDEPGLKKLIRHVEEYLDFVKANCPALGEIR